MFYGKNVPSLHEYIVAGLVQQRPYRFRIQAENFNGLSALSDIATHWTCLPPSMMDPPVKVQSTATSMFVKWAAPKDDGGCPITGYALFRDDGITEIPSIEVNSVNDPLIRNIPTLRQVEVQLGNANLGKWFKYEVRAFNSEGMISAQSVRLLFAIEPSKPSQAPVVVKIEATAITVSYVDGSLVNGGSPILSHHL